MDAVGHSDRAGREDPRRREPDVPAGLPVRAAQPRNRDARLAASPAADPRPRPGYPTADRVDSHQWIKNVLEQWQLAAAVSLVVPLPSQGATDEHRTVISRLITAKQRLTAGKPDDLKASVAASREAVELLRTMRPTVINTAARDRDLAEREAVILGKMTDLANALFSYDSAASHIDPHLRDITWRRENAVLALGTATSLAQLIFART